jgi:hypothetical protein
VEDIELAPVLGHESQRVALVEREGIVGLQGDVNAGHVETSAVVAHASTASATKEVEQLGPHAASPGRWCRRQQGPQ